MGQPETHRHVEDFLGELDRAFHLGATARQNDPGGNHLFKPAPAQLLTHQPKQFLVARLDDLGECLAGKAPGRTIAHARNLDALIGVGELGQRAGVPDLDVLRILRRRTHGDGDVVRDLVAGDGDDGRVPDRPVGKDRDVGGAAADVDQADAQLLLVLGEHRETRRQLLEHDVIHFQPAALDAFLDVLRSAVGPGDDVHLGLQAYPGHADRIADALLAVHDELLGQHVEDFLVCRDRNRFGGVDDVLDVALGHLFIPHPHDSMRVETAHVATGDACEHRVDFAAGHQLGLLHRALDRLHGRFDVDDDALLESPGRL